MDPRSLSPLYKYGFFTSGNLHYSRDTTLCKLVILGSVHYLWPGWGGRGGGGAGRKFCGLLLWGRAPTFFSILF